MAKKKKNKKGYHYCEKHDQHYMNFLHECPICRGELLGARIKAGLPHTLRIRAIRRKDGK
jgi:hypothetical protein